ncbi:M23 family metallopeptidase [Microgenomates group bacterium]|nr:M23 family metallopeptidase [Microgenomates group bacterium]
MTKLTARQELARDIGLYRRFVIKYIKSRIYVPFSKFELGKDTLVGALYKKRGKYAHLVSHVGMILLVFILVMAGPVVLEQNNEGVGAGLTVVMANDDELSMYTIRAEDVQRYRGGEVVVHTAREGETLEEIAQRYGLEVNTLVWENGLADEKAQVKEGQELRILPIDGVRVKVARGDTIFTLAKKYGLEEAQTQMIVDYPFNEFANDETFELVTGQELIIPYGVQPRNRGTTNFANTYVRQVMTPDAGAVAGSGQFIWPASGGISQGFIPGIHQAIDISNRGGGPILAADSGTVVQVGWSSSGYGNMIMVDHGNGFVTLYAHLSTIQVEQGQTVASGNVIGQMGSTGRSTGIHLHFEVRYGGALLNPLGYL